MPTKIEGRKDVQHPDAQLMLNFPTDGTPYDDGSNPPPQDPPADDPPPAPTPDPYEDLRARLTRQEEEIDRLRRMQVPPQPKAPTPPPQPEEKEDFDTRFFRNPKEVLENFGKEVEDRVTRQLEARYQQDRATQKFWEDFYQQHNDLKQDHDLVEMVLNKNLGEMSSLPVKTAMDRLADLTRERILRYAGGGNKSRAPKVKVEGASPPTPPKPKATEEKILSISDLIRKRRVDRRRAASGV